MNRSSRLRAGQRPQQLPVRRAEVLALVHEHVVGREWPLARVATPAAGERPRSTPPRRSRCVPLIRDCARYASMTSQTADRLARSSATPRPGRRTLKYVCPAGDPAGQDDLGVLGGEELLAAQGAGRADPAASSASRQADPGSPSADLRGRRPRAPPRRRRRWRPQPAAAPRWPARRSRPRSTPGSPSPVARGSAGVEPVQVGPAADPARLVVYVVSTTRAPGERRASIRARCSSTTVFPVPAPPDSRNGPE